MPSKCIVYKCENMGVHSFPKTEALKQQWIKAARLETLRKFGRSLCERSLICSAHFEKSDYTPTAWTHLGGDIQRKVLKPNVVPSVFPWTSKKNDETELNYEIPPVDRTYSRAPPTTFVEEFPDTLFEENETQKDPLALDDECTPSFNDYEMETQILKESTQVLTEFNEVPHCGIEITIDSLSEVKKSHPTLCETSSRIDKSVQTIKTDNTFSIESIKHRAKTVHFYTGLENYKKFMMVFHTLGPCSYNLNYFYENPPSKVYPVDQFFLTLIILYRHRTFEEMANVFFISKKQVYNIFVTWIRFMALQWQNIDTWVDRETVKENMPRDFYDKYPATRVVLDATECPIKKPKLPLAQQITFSTYKNKNTVKCMIGITPSGLISYVSPCYGGSTTDRQIMEQSTILHKFEYGDEIMVDKGINIQDILVSYGVKVNMPAFFKKGNQIEPSTLNENRKVASKRVHVERIIGLMKTYKILTEPMNHTETLLSSNIVFICATLVNFRSNIISKNA